jgi:hypothetical protein
MVAVAAGGTTVAWWLLTGRGPGGKIVSVEQAWLAGTLDELMRVADALMTMLAGSAA